VVATQDLERLPVTLGGHVSRHGNKRKPRVKSTTPPTPPRAPQRERQRQRRRPDLEERPKAPWHPFPLIEIAVLVGIVCIVIGLIEHDSPAGRALLVLGLALGSLGGLDTALREHFAGYRGHTLVLAATPAVAITVVLAVAKAPAIVLPIAAVALFGIAAIVLRAAYTRAQYPHARGG
jgi:hypothetical protein